jgi:hypothetical protein
MEKELWSLLAVKEVDDEMREPPVVVDEEMEDDELEDESDSDKEAVQRSVKLNLLRKE